MNYVIYHYNWTLFIIKLECYISYVTLYYICCYDVLQKHIQKLIIFKIININTMNLSN